MMQLYAVNLDARLVYRYNGEFDEWVLADEWDYGEG